MAKKINKRFNSNKVRRTGVRRKKGSNYDKELTRFAYKMGLVQRGIDAGGTKVADSYNAGRERKERKPKKPLF